MSSSNSYHRRGLSALGSGPGLAIVLALASELVLAVAVGLPAHSDDSVQVVTLGSATGLNAFSPGKWGLVRVAVMNSGKEPATVRATVSFKDSPELRFGRDVWVPAGAMRTTSIPIHFSDELAEGGTVEIVGRVVAGAPRSNATAITRLARISPPGATAFVDDGIFARMDEDGSIEDPAYEAVLAMMGARGMPRMIAMPSERLLPATIEGWDAVRHVVVAGKRLTNEAGAATALRGWVAEGGTMWIQLNRAGPETVRAIFGSSLEMAVLDRVPLTTFDLNDSGSDFGPSTTSIDTEEPIELIRARVDGGDLLFDVDGWPAAVEFRYGRGSVIVTLLDASGWIRSRGPGDPPFSDPLTYTDFIALDPLQDLADRLYQPRSQPRLDREVLAGFVSDQIGYKIPGRGVVLSVLVLFCLVIFVVGSALMARQRLEHVAWIAASVGIVAALILVSLGRSQRGEVLPTLADFQLVTIVSQTGDYSATGVVAVFQPDQERADFDGQGNRVDPQMPELTGQIRQWIWRDGNRWRWDSTRLPAGITVMESESFGTLTAPPRALATFATGGLEGEFDAAGLVQWAATEANPSTVTFDDAIVLFPHSRPLAANLRPDGRFSSGESDRLAVGQFTNAVFLNDEQRRRIEVLDPWFDRQHATGNAIQPMLVVWMNDSANNLRSDQVSERIGTSMVSVPLQFVRPAPGSRVTIPSVAIRSLAVPGEQGQSTAFENQFERWAFPQARANVTRLRFQIPQSVLPIRLESATLVLDCHLPSRPLQLFLVQDNQRFPIGSYRNPSGDVEVTIQDADRLDLDPDGGLTVDILVGELQTEVEELNLANAGWSIRSSRLHVSGVTLPVATEDNDEQP